MSIKASSWAWSQHAIGTTQKLVLLALADFANAEGKCWPSQREIAFMSDTTDRNVRRMLDDLERLGLISKVRRGSTRGGRLADCYQLALPDPGYASGQSVRMETGQMEGGLPDTSDRLLQSVCKPSGTVNAREARESEIARFEEFWTLYPRRTARGAAEKAWRKVIVQGRAKADELIEGARRHRAEMVGTEERFIRHASTWLNNDGWKDEPIRNDIPGNSFQGNVTRQRLDPPDELLFEWSASGILDEDLPARIRAWRQEQLAAVNG